MRGGQQRDRRRKGDTEVAHDEGAECKEAQGHRAGVSAGEITARKPREERASWRGAFWIPPLAVTPKKGFNSDESRNLPRGLCLQKASAGGSTEQVLKRCNLGGRQWV